MASNESPSVAPAGYVSSTGAGVSFSIAKRTQSRLVGKTGTLAETRDGRRGGSSMKEPEKDYIYSLEEGNIHSSNPVPGKKEYIIPLIRKVVWRGVSDGGGGGGGSDGGGGGGGGEEGESVTKSVSTSDGVKTEEELALDREAAEAIISDLKSSKSEGEEVEGGHVIPLLLQNKPPVGDDGEAGELADLSMRPDPSTDENYEDMPIAEFGKAMLRGMGWKEGTAIGKNNKGMIAPVEFIPRLGKLGLGAAPKPQEAPRKKRPGEPEKKVVQGPYIGADGKVKHMRYIGVDIPEQPIEGFRPGNYARVLTGPHAGLCGKIVSATEGGDQVALRMAINSQVLEFTQRHLELISKEEYSKPPVKQSTSKEYGLIKRKGDSSGSEPSPSKSLAVPSSTDRETRSGGESKERRKRQADSDSHHKRAKRSKHSDRTELTEARSGSNSAIGSSSSSGRESTREILWVAPNLRVRIIDTSFKRGKYYNNKVEILDVVSGDQCVCRTDDGRHLEGVHQSMLETVVPKTQNAAVMIVGGKRHRREVGRLLERDLRNYKATVELVYTSQVLTVDYDDICEFTGDVDD